MKNLIVRSQTALIFVIVMIGGIWLSAYSYLTLVALIILFCLNEYVDLIRLTQPSNRVSVFYKPFTFLVGLGFFVTSYFVATNVIHFKIYLLPMAGLFVFYIIELLSRSEKPLENTALNVNGIVYIAVPFALLNHLAFHSGSYQPYWVLGIILLVWINDAWAYAVGSLVGKTKLFPRISPNKTLEGWIGGLVGCFIVAYLEHIVFGLIPLHHWLITGFVVCISATFGDLVVSMYKRSLEIKDTGKFFPGHGGFLDRFDALIIAIPFAVAYLILFAL